MGSSLGTQIHIWHLLPMGTVLLGYLLEVSPILLGEAQPELGSLCLSPSFTAITPCYHIQRWKDCQSLEPTSGIFALPAPSQVTQLNLGLWWLWGLMPAPPVACGAGAAPESTCRKWGSWGASSALQSGLAGVSDPSLLYFFPFLLLKVLRDFSWQGSKDPMGYRDQP